MSREFGSYINGYFHHQIEQSAEDCLNGRDGLTKLWGEFLKEFSHIAYAISTSEACDSGEDYPIMECMKRLPNLRERFKKIEAYITPFEDVARRAVSEKADK